MKNHNKHNPGSSRKIRVHIAAASPQQAGFTLLELLICLALSTIIILGLSDILSTSLATRRIVHAENDSALQAEFAMDRMLRMVAGSRRLMLPLGENPATAWSESVRNVLAVTLPASIDLDNNGIADADNDADGRIDEDMWEDNTNDHLPGISGIDDDNDGTVDEGSEQDNDEDGTAKEDILDSIDNDGDGSIDEDFPKDMNDDGKPGIKDIDDDGDGEVDEGSNEDDDEDGVRNEDWFDPVVYFLSGTTLVERLPVPWNQRPPAGIDGLDYIESPLAENVTRFEVTRINLPSGRAGLVTIILELAGPDGEPYTLTATARLGGGL